MTNSLERELALMSLLNHSLNSSWELGDGKVGLGQMSEGRSVRSWGQGSSGEGSSASAIP